MSFSVSAWRRSSSSARSSQSWPELEFAPITATFFVSGLSRRARSSVERMSYSLVAPVMPEAKSRL